MAYRYEAYTLDKRIVKGNIDAATESIAEGMLYGEGYSRVLSLKEIPAGARLEKFLPSIVGVKTQDVIEFSNQLATLIDSGMPIITAMRLLENQATKAALKRVIGGLSRELQGGSSFSQALLKYPQAFSTVYCQVVKASEYTGNLGVALRQAAGYIEKSTAMLTRIKRAMAYPTVVLLMAIGVVALITNVAFPPLARLFTSLGAELPLPTRILIFIATFTDTYKLYLIVGLLAAAVFAFIYLRLPAGKLAMDKNTLKIPLIGNIIIARNMSQFCRTTSLLLEAGIPLPQIMSVAIGAVGNRIIRQALTDVREKLLQGQAVSQSMAKIAVFPELLVEMVVVGEKTGTLQPTLGTLSDFYEQAVDQKVRVLVAAMQNGLIVFIGLVVGFIGISMITPLYSILKTIR